MTGQTGTAGVRSDPNPSHCLREVLRHKSRAPPRAHARQGTETGHLVGTREVLRDGRTTGSVVIPFRVALRIWIAAFARTLAVVRTVKSQINDNGCSARNNNKMTNGSVSYDLGGSLAF